MNSGYNSFKDLGANATLNVSKRPCRVFSLACHNENAADRYIQLHDTATVPTTTVTVPVFSFLVPTGAMIIVGTDFFGPGGLAVQATFGTPGAGLAFAFSTTKDVYTAATASEQSTWINFA